MINEPHQQGSIPWTNDELRDGLKEFAELYENRPIRNNDGGMKAAQMFYAWFVAKKMQPDVIIESGVWYGQSTWAFELAAPRAEIHCLDPVPYYKEEKGYYSQRANYYSQDFLQLDWTHAKKENSLCFFDDHQDALARLARCCELGFKTIIFEDNYPPGQGDCYSLKKAFHPQDNRCVAPGLRARDYAAHIIKTYFEFPPVLKADTNRWGLPWETYATSAPLLEETNEDYQKIYLEELKNYTWINYVELK